MSDQNPTAAPAPAPIPKDPTDWKSAARKWEKRSKDNLAELDTLTGKVADLETANSELTAKVASYEAPAPTTEGESTEGDPAEPADPMPADAAPDDLEPADEPPTVPIIESQGKMPQVREDSDRIAVRQLFGR